MTRRGLSVKYYFGYLYSQTTCLKLLAVATYFMLTPTYTVCNDLFFTQIQIQVTFKTMKSRKIRNFYEFKKPIVKVRKSSRFSKSFKILKIRILNLLFNERWAASLTLTSQLSNALVPTIRTVWLSLGFVYSYLYVMSCMWQLQNKRKYDDDDDDDDDMTFTPPNNPLSRHCARVRWDNWCRRYGNVTICNFLIVRWDMTRSIVAVCTQ